MRRTALSASASVLAVAVALAVPATSPAGAAESPPPSVTWEPTRTADGPHPDDAPLAGRIRIEAAVSSEEPVEDWTIRLLAVTAGGERDLGNACEGTVKRPRRNPDLECVWSTTAYPDDSPSANGEHLLRVAVRTEHGTVTARPDRPVRLANPPVRPAGVRLSVADDGRTVTLAWDPNPEPDGTGYVVEERSNRADWADVGQTTETTYRRTLKKAGRYDFRVSALRRGAGAPDTLRGAPSKPRGRDQRVTVKDDAPPEPPAGPSTRPETTGASRATVAPAGPADAGSRDPAAPAAGTSQDGAAAPPVPSGSPTPPPPVSASPRAANHRPGAPAAAATSASRRPAAGRWPAEAAARFPAPDAGDPGFSAALPYPDPPAGAAPEAGAAGEPLQREVAADLASRGQPRTGRPRWLTMGGFGLVGLAGALALTSRRLARRAAGAPETAGSVEIAGAPATAEGVETAGAAETFPAAGMVKAVDGVDRPAPAAAVPGGGNAVDLALVEHLLELQLDAIRAARSARADR